MKLAGINNLLRETPATQAKGRAFSAKGESKSSFEEVFGQATEAKPQASPQDKVTVKSEEKTLPAQPTPPSLSGPLKADQLPLPQAEPAVLMPLVSTAPVIANPEQEVDGLTRRVVWNDFLRKMKEEFGVTAEDVLNAFSSLSAEELAQPPEQNVEKVVMALGLDPQAAQIAKQYFNELLHKTNPKSLGDELASSGRQIDLTLMSQRELQRKQTDRRLDQMQTSFFMKNEKAMAERPMAEKPMAASIAKPTQMPFEKPLETSIDDMAPLMSQMQEVDSSAIPDTAVDDLVKKFVSAQAAPAKAIPVTDMPPMMMAPATKANANPNPVAALAPTVTPVLERGENGETATEDEDFTSDASFLGGGITGDSSTQGLNVGGEFKTTLAQAAPGAPQASGIQDIVSQAQVMVRDGGGEMKVKLNQEGLGEVAMKVNVDQGKVSVQMVTESDEAKRLIDRHLHDLRESLSANSLQVETIKVDTASNIGKQLDQQYQDAQRQAAHQALEQFRQDHQGWRRSFFEVPGARNYKGQTEGPRDVQPPTDSGRRAGSRRLDLVA